MTNNIVFAIIIVAVAAMCVPHFIAHNKMQAINKSIDELINRTDEMFASLAKNVVELDRRIEEIENLPEDKLEKLETEVLKRASNKIELGINSILNYDPYNAFGQNEEVE